VGLYSTKGVKTMTATPQKSPTELRTERFESLRSRWNTLADKVGLNHLRHEIEEMNGAIESLPHQIQDIRRRGYIYGRGWDAQVKTLEKGWPERQREARRILQDEARRMEEGVKDVETLCGRSHLSDGELDRLDNRLDRLDSQVSSAETAVRGAFGALESQKSSLESELEAATFLLDSLDDASFKLFPEEHGVAACEAVWVSDKDEPKGLLFLTDGRIVFEQREKKALKKVLFITTKSEMVQEKLWEAPVGALSEIETQDEKGGFLGLGSKEMLTLRFRERTRELPSDVIVQVKGTTNEAWQTLIKRVQGGEIEADHYQAGTPAPAAAAVTAPPPAAPATPPAAIPTKCPSCGAQLPTVFKGMREIDCDYCGAKVRF